MAFGDVGEHQDEAAVAIPSETGVAGGFGELFDGLVVHAEVKDGIHHARHGHPGAGTDGDKKGDALAAAEGFVIDLFNLVNVLDDVVPDIVGDFFATLVVERASFGGDGEAGGDVDARGGHLGKTETFSAKDFLAKLRFMAFLEGVDVFLFCHYCPPVDNVHWRIKAP